MRGEEVGRFREVAGVSIIDVGAGWSVFVVDTLTVDSRVAFRLWDESSSGWGRGLCTGCTSARLALKMQGGLMCEGGKGGGGAYLQDTTVHL